MKFGADWVMVDSFVSSSARLSNLLRAFKYTDQFIIQTKIQTLCFRAHSYPIEHLAFDRSGLKLATGAQQELKVWRYLSAGLPSEFIVTFENLFYPQDRLRHVNDLSPPGAASLIAQESTLVTSLHWLHSGDDAGCLLATYLYQGIM
jgi:hypothetical protein